MVVDLPAPLGPRKPWTSPSRTLRSRPSSATVRPNDLRRPDTEMTSVMPSTLHLFRKSVNVVIFAYAVRRVPQPTRVDASGSRAPTAHDRAHADVVEHLGGALADAGPGAPAGAGLRGADGHRRTGG